MTLELPKSFEDFVDAKKAGFIHVKNYIENGGHLIAMQMAYLIFYIFLHYDS